MNETLGRHTEASVNPDVRGQLAIVGGNVLWRLVGVAVGIIGITAEVGFELEMHRVALRNQWYASNAKT